MEFTNNFFEIFGQPESYAIDLVALSSRYRELQQEFHPDRYVDKPERERSLAMQWAATINQAYDTLKSPLKRGQYLLAQQGFDSTGESTITSDPMFLMEQIELRESLGDIGANEDPFAALDELRNRIEREYRQLQDEYQANYAAADYPQALDVIAKMQFFVKLLAEIELLEDDLDQ